MNRDLWLYDATKKSRECWFHIPVTRGNFFRTIFIYLQLMFQVVYLGAVQKTKNNSGRIRTYSLLIGGEMLYHLSYVVLRLLTSDLAVKR